MKGKRVVITGLGALSPLGNDPKTNWANALAGKSGVATIDRFPVDDLAVKFGGLVKDFDPELASPGKLSRVSALFVLYAAEVARQALADANLKLEDPESYHAGVAFGSGVGGLKWIENSHDAMVQKGSKRISPYFIPGSIINTAAGRISMSNNLKGPNVAAVSACATGIHNIGLAARMIAYGEADVMVAGGTETLDTALNVGGFAALRALSKDNDTPEKASRPFDETRNGFVLGEGACALVLESLEHAQARGAHIYAELKGFGMSADAHHITSPSSEGAVRAMQAAIADADLKPEDIDHINAHATSTPLGDESELKAVKAVFGDHTRNIAISATKSMTGHLLGATGALECMFSIQALNDQKAPPTINLQQPTVGDDFNLVANKAQDKKMDTVLCNSFGFGGTNASLVFTKI